MTDKTIWMNLLPVYASPRASAPCALHRAPKYNTDKQREFQGQENTKLSTRWSLRLHDNRTLSDLSLSQDAPKKYGHLNQLFWLPFLVSLKTNILLLHQDKIPKIQSSIYLWRIYNVYDSVSRILINSKVFGHTTEFGRKDLKQGVKVPILFFAKSRSVYYHISAVSDATNLTWNTFFCKVDSFLGHFKESTTGTTLMWLS